MSEHPEQGLVFRSGDAQLVGVLHPAASRRGVLVVVGGPQYRAGSHRQFTLLARRLAAGGIPALRFDCQGYGDSSGERAGFLAISDDITAAVGAFHAQMPDLEEIAIWGLCDAVSAVLLHPRLPPMVRGLVLLNPWVTEAGSPPETVLRHYYLRRVLSGDFWRKLLSGKVASVSSLRDLGSTAAGALQRRLQRGSEAGATESGGSLAARMAAGLERFAGPVLLITSGQDLTAGEFLDTARADRRWQAILSDPRLRHEHLSDANHTFSTARWRAQVENLTLEWLGSW